MASPISGQVSVTGTAVQVTATPVNVTAWVLKAPLTNANPIFIGSAGVTTSTGHQLDPGDSFEYERNSQNGQPNYALGPNDVYVCGTASDKATWFASPA